MSKCRLNENWWKVTKEEEYKKNKELKQSDVNIIQEWLIKQQHLPQLNDNQIIMFLRVWDYSLEQTKTSIDIHYTMRTKYPQLFSQRSLKRRSILNCMDYLQVGFLQNIIDNDLLIITKMSDVDPATINIEESIKLFYMYHDMAHLEYGSKSGYYYIIDMKYVTLSLILRLPITVIGNVIKLLQDCSTFRMKDIHIVNGGQIFKRLFQMFQQFLNSEIIGLIQVHDDYESLRKVVEANFLPSEYGGEAPSLQQLHNEALTTLKKYDDWFIEEEMQRIVDKKKTENNKFNELQGSFRKLNVD